MATTPDEARAQLKIAEAASDWIQWDIMDGKFVKDKTWADPQIIKTWRIRPSIELHFMVEDPTRMIDAWKEVPKWKRVIWHIEADVDHKQLIAECHRLHREVGLAISPGTSLLEITPFLDFLDVVLVMTVVPGRGVKEFLPETLNTIAELRRLAPELPIEVDGGINEKNILMVAKKGASRFVMNHAIYSHPFPADFLKGQLEKLNRLP
jgi:ribulose-phosphate 3-epimerase